MLENQRVGFPLSILVCFFLTSPVRADTYALVMTRLGWKSEYKIHRQEINAIKRTCSKPLHIRSFVEKRATRDNYFKTMKWLKKNVKKDDMVIIMIDAHGSYERFEYRAWLYNDESLTARDIRTTVEAIQGTTLLVVDTCHAGAVLKEEWKKTTVLCASCTNEASYGRCTARSFLEALNGKADTNKDGRLSVNEVVIYVRARTIQIAFNHSEQQHTMVFFGDGQKRIIN